MVPRPGSCAFFSLKLKIDTLQMSGPENKKLQKKIMAVGGGKGGIGKSVISANLAIGLALSGMKVVLVDLDLGCSNLHAILGLKTPKTGIKDFIINKKNTLNSVVVETKTEGLQFICGAGDLPGVSNISHHEKNRLIMALNNLTADLVIMDLGPGINYSVIDFFCIAHRGILVSTPEVTSVTNSFSFIRSILFRQLENLFSSTDSVKELLKMAKNNSNSLEGLQEKARRIDPMYDFAIRKIIQRLRPELIMNRVRKKPELKMGFNFQAMVKKYLKVDVAYLGHLVESERVRNSVEEMTPFIQNSKSEASRCMRNILASL